MAPGIEAPAPRPFSWWWIGIALPASVAVGFTVAAILWGGTRAEHRDAFDTGWKSAAAVLAVLAAIVAVERLRLGQREHHRLLAADQAKEINELSAKASEQLGSDKAAVRIGGLTDLERLAQAHPGLRQTVVDRICAYLRGPYRPPPRRTNRVHLPSSADDGDPAHEDGSEDAAGAERRLELDVRRTAQQILKRHLSPDDTATFWPDISLDLRDANLVEFDLAGCRVGDVTFVGATFHRDATFEQTQFRGGTDFDDADFTGAAEFGESKFDRTAYFVNVRFAVGASFSGASLNGAYFQSCFFHEMTSFVRTTFSRDTSFTSAVFMDDVNFTSAVFQRETDFDDAGFHRRAGFTKTEFNSSPSFDGASFREQPDFTGAQVADADAGHIWPAGWIAEDGGVHPED
ncbi:pentapeptide repeat-containing protein [Amycolatopsis sp. SID8362]|uniref:pentapeptide repeat-containing protein n=1 Tax=Amycolatopsis sp. SID8362 TaxID=2690346 RepID=UPI00136F030E|nr:pentapeptide repeat-containing protein [Amycolatopsis sp. SID8362]NBH03053.1 hypothetical protein [Amycolatopsis sp. SID8362]NED39754.1 pentapeptide repeat-containing protein [Amycolatopsis sp. SID8362]